MTDEGQSAATLEDTLDDDAEAAAPAEAGHRHFDVFADGVPAGVNFASRMKHLPGARRRQSDRLGVSRTPFLEPLADKRPGPSKSAR